MTIPGLETLKTWGLIALGFALSIVTVLFKSEQAARAKDKLKGEVQARKTANAVNKSVIEGLNNEQEEINEAAKPNPKRDDFE